MPQLNHPFKIALTTFIRYQKYITNATKLPYSNAKLEANNKLIRNIKRNAFGYRNCDNFKKRIYLALNSKKARTTIVLARA
ncbi:potassium transporter peripheral membrane component [Streptococcus lutetiensis 033]|uniref:Potassium transporter peripheral membrane component n=1 Tax=Streptococcus lutetiensis 033 TaxID=1076934 RepID=A0AB33AK02_9STRE|nr:potassium transporter peripheral membrane component [Streptococcus lutetiensis 033]